MASLYAVDRRLTHHSAPPLPPFPGRVCQVLFGIRRRHREIWDNAAFHRSTCVVALVKGGFAWGLCISGVGFSLLSVKDPAAVARPDD